MKRFFVGLILSVLLISGLAGFAQENVVLNYNGRLRVGGTPFTGTGHFMFALENKNGEIFWSSGDFPFVGKGIDPTNALKIPVQEGAYVAHLGASSAGMP